MFSQREKLVGTVTLRDICTKTKEEIKALCNHGGYIENVLLRL